ncbi:WecB/TagA/CpsF family glycosyltransferase [Dyadobacter sp. CY261]|uniref:WecB/TagA/CpsF family glycosyltransferase n=1 Tax=Dyadobacter sp. CY261 TaxID=2907203 RepID=UPI001F262649|nr:WecB/TagA/CpsF family glycosyltransferase [Dyadobacter sp. CY261]MCF0075134.1 WecB/TagA/CpsF family glycosyltransferase [Dyadobacter sp. CY261]
MKKPFLGINISVGAYRDILGQIVELAKASKPGYVCIANVHMLVEASRDVSFSSVVNNSTICTADGMPLVWGLKKTHNIHQDRVAGMDLLPDLLQAAEKDSIPIFFYGGTEKMLETTKNFLKANYPYLKLAGTISPPFRALTKNEEIDIIQTINASGAKIVFVALGCPKQEKWMNAVTSRVNALLIGIGGALPVMVGMQKRAPAWMQRFALEWLYRLCQEPGRLFKRYWSTNIAFAMLLVRQASLSQGKK